MQRSESMSLPLARTQSTRARSQAGLVWQNLLRNKGALAGAVILVLLVAIALAAPLVSPYDPLKTSVVNRLKPPGRDFLMGTDQLGRDTFSRVLYGGRTSLWLGIVSVAIGATIGGVLGMIAGFYRGTVDMVISRIVDMMMAMPRILLALIIIFTLGPGVINVMIAVGVSAIPDYARVVRSSVLSAREHTYVEAARVVGAPDREIMFRHILPNVVAPLIVVSTLGLGGAILSAAGLSFLGLGARPPVVEWGVLLSDGRNRLSVAWWLTTFPGIAIMLTVLAINLLGDGLRDALDPRLQRR